MEISVLESCRSQMREWLMFTSEILRTLETPNTANQESYFLTSQPSWRLCMRVLAVKNMNHGDLTVCHPQDTEICTPQEDLQIDMEDIEMIPMMIGSGVARLPEDPLEDHHDTTTIAVHRQGEADTEAVAMIMDTGDHRQGEDIGAAGIMEVVMDVGEVQVVLWMI